MEESVELLKCLEEKIQIGKDMIERLKAMEKVNGIDKLIRKIKQEMRFLEKVQSTGNVKKEHLQSTNLIHLKAMVDHLFCVKDLVSIMKPFKYLKTRLEVDMVCDGGASWVKVIARNARALTLISLGNGEYGQKSVLDQADFYLKCAKNHPYMYRAPTVVFHFAYGVETPLAKRLTQLGVVVEGRITNSVYKAETSGSTIEVMSDVEEHDEESLLLESGDESSDEIEEKTHDLEGLNTRVNSTEIKILNLDVSTLLAFVTNMTNGHAHFIFREPLLTKQAEWERSRPVEPILNQLFKDKELIVCQTAYDNFMNIIDVIGGPNETLRANDLMRKVRIVEDIAEGRIMERLPLGGRIKARSRLVFATGENIKSITVSANEGFVRAAHMQGIECAVFLHEPRSLSEVKENHAKRIHLF